MTYGPFRVSSRPQPSCPWPKGGMFQIVQMAVSPLLSCSARGEEQSSVKGDQVDNLVNIQFSH